MRTTIKKMIRFGLKKEDIKAEFGLNDEQYSRYERQGRYMEVKNLPELLEKYNTDKVINSNDREKADIFDKLFRLEDEEIPNLTTEQKSGLLAAFPHFIQHLQKEIAEKEIEKLEEQIATIKEQINNICLENGMAVKYPSAVLKEEIETIAENLDGTKYNAFGEIIEEKPEPKIIEAIYGEGIRLQSSHYSLDQNSLLLAVKKDYMKHIEVGDKLIVKHNGEIYKYTIIKKTVKDRASYIKVVKEQQ